QSMAFPNGPATEVNVPHSWTVRPSGVRVSFTSVPGSTGPAAGTHSTAVGPADVVNDSGPTAAARIDDMNNRTIRMKRVSMVSSASCPATFEKSTSRRLGHRSIVMDTFFEPLRPDEVANFDIEAVAIALVREFAHFGFHIFGALFCQRIHFGLEFGSRRRQ